MVPLPLIREMLGKNINGHTLGMAILDGTSPIPQPLGYNQQLYTVASFHVTHAFWVLSRDGYRLRSLVVLENHEVKLNAQKFLREV